MKDVLQKIQEVANEQIAQSSQVEDWTLILEELNVELNKNIQTYNSRTENAVFSLIRKAENLILESNILSFDQGSSYESTYENNSHPFILASNKRTIKYLIPEMYEFDNQFDQQLSNINLPSLFLYGQYDVRTPKSQAEYVMNNISTDQTDQRLVILPSSGHSSVGNEPVKLVTEIKQWIELYK